MRTDRRLLDIVSTAQIHAHKINKASINLNLVEP